VNLYAFHKTVSREHGLDEAVESIDIGGPALIRAAAKNYANTIVVVDPDDYPSVIAAIRNGITGELGFRLAAKAFRHTACYDSMISRYLTERAGEPELSDTLTIGMEWDGAELRYGENSHQKARRYLDPMESGALRALNVDSAKAISYNNWLDAEAAWDIARGLPPGACAIIKHGNPCGAALGTNLGESYRLARESDPISAFGGIVAFHGEVDDSAIDAMTEKGNFLEVVVSAGWPNADATERLTTGPAWGKNLRLLIGSLESHTRPLAIRSLRGAYLVQEIDEDPGEAGWLVASKRSPSEAEWDAMRFLWAIIPNIKSNAIAVGTGNRLLGVGAGQMNRVQSVRLALEQAGDGARGAALASDAFFPFPDSIETAASAGISAIIQPGGSKKDADVIAAADQHGLAVVLTGTRHFRH
jgi:phosphoribosylaminoimidazolecarboxamide formyltransferase/IMP cyclohydrolase